MGFFSAVKNGFIGIKNRLANSAAGVKVMKLMTDEGDTGYFSFDGKLYHSDVVRSAVRPFASAVGKAVGKHIRHIVNVNGEEDIRVNPEAYIRFLLTEPNPYMTGQELQERLASQLALNNNAFALIIRDNFGYPEQIYPITAYSVTKRYDKSRNLFLEFVLLNGRTVVFPYEDIIHLRDDFYTDDIFGTPKYEALLPLMECVSAIDSGIVHAIKNSSVIRWLLTYNTTLRPEDLKKNAREFAVQFLENSDTMGVAAVDTKARAEQISQKEYIPPSSSVKLITERIYSIFNTNAAIVNSDWTENQWNAYYESNIEPALLKFANAFTNRIFSRRERGCGNEIVFESYNLSAASIETKLNLREMVDRGAMTTNEWRAAFGMAAVPGGNKLLLRKDTGVITEEGGESDENN